MSLPAHRVGRTHVSGVSPSPVADAPDPSRRETHAQRSRILRAIRDAMHGGSWSDFARSLRALLDATPRIQHRVRARIAADLESIEDEIVRELGVKC